MAQREELSDTLILGIGNILRRDDGVGVRVIERLRGLELPEGVEVVDAGNAMLNLVDLIAGRRKVVIIDAIKAGGQPGSIYRFTPGDTRSQWQPVTSLHEIGLLEALALAHDLGIAPDNVVIVGVEPATIEWGTSLSSEVEAAVPRLVELVLHEVRPQS